MDLEYFITEHDLVVRQVVASAFSKSRANLLAQSILTTVYLVILVIQLCILLVFIIFQDSFLPLILIPQVRPFHA